MASAAVISSSHPLTAESSRSAQQAMDQDDENDLLAIRITAAGDTPELERDYADDLEDLVACVHSTRSVPLPAGTLTQQSQRANSLSVVQHLGQKRSRLPKLQLQPAAAESATGLHPKSPSLYASPRAPSVSVNQQGWETLQAGTTSTASSEPLSAAVPAALLPRPSQRRIESERSTRIPGKRKTATAEQRSVSQPPAARVRLAAARVDSSQIPPATTTSLSSARPRLATDLPSRLPTPRRRVPSQSPIRSFSPRTGTAENLTKHAVTTTDLEPEEIASSQTTTTAVRATTMTRQTPASSGGRTGTLRGEEPTTAGTRRLPVRPTTARVSTSRRTVPTSRMRTKSAPWPTSSGGDESNEPLPPWFDDSGPRIYRSSEGKLTFAGTDPDPSPPPSSAAAPSATGSLLLLHHRPQDRVLPAVAKRIQAERLTQLQADDQGLGDAWLVSEWGVTGDPRRVISFPMKALEAELDSVTTPTSNAAAAAAATVLPQLSSRVAADSTSRPTEAVMIQPDPPPGPPGGDFPAAAAECITTTAPSSPPRQPPTEEGDSSLSVALAEHGKSRYEPEQRAAGDHHQRARSQTGLGHGSSSPPSFAVGRADSRYSSVRNTAQDDESEARTADPKSPGCCASCVIC